MTLSSDQIVIYVGPSLAIEDAREILEADYRPPVRRGDIAALMKSSSPPKIVGIVDGKFFQSFAISPKEMLPALEAGVVMLGSSSMGALRAVELLPYGMIGVGRIFEMFRTGELDADDEVGMVYDEDSGRARSVPMANIRVALEAAAAEGIITKDEERMLIKVIKDVYFPERTYPLMLKLAGDSISASTRASLSAFLKNGAPDAKRDDAMNLLREVKRIAAA